VCSAFSLHLVIQIYTKGNLQHWALQKQTDHGKIEKEQSFLPKGGLFNMMQSHTKQVVTRALTENGELLHSTTKQYMSPPAIPLIEPCFKAHMQWAHKGSNPNTILINPPQFMCIAPTHAQPVLTVTMWSAAWPLDTENKLVTTTQVVQWDSGLSSMETKSQPWQHLVLHHPAHSKLLYRLHYPGTQILQWHQIFVGLHYRICFKSAF